MALIEFVDGVTKGNAETFNNNFNEVNKVNVKNDASLLMSSNDVIPITPLVGSNYGNYGNSYYYKKGTKVHVHLGLSGLTANTSNTVFQLPEGYRPQTIMPIHGLGQGMGYPIAGQVSGSGTINVYPEKGYAIFDFEFEAFN